MSLFSDTSRGDFDRALSLVEQTLVVLGIDPKAVRADDASGIARFSLRRGSALVILTLAPATSSMPEGALRIVAPVVRLPAAPKQPALFRRVLEINAGELSGAAFAVIAEELVIVAQRGLRDLDASEVEIVLRGVGRAADRYDDLLAREFDTTRSSDDASTGA